jgi:hypothetical protein
MIRSMCDSKQSTGFSPSFRSFVHVSTFYMVVLMGMVRWYRGWEAIEVDVENVGEYGIEKCKVN